MARIAVLLLGWSLVQPVFAQDKPESAPSADRWSGYYLGINAGYANAPGNGIKVDTWNTGTALPGLVGQNIRRSRTQSVPAGLGTNPDGLFGGLQAGRNWRVAPEWVVGLEANANLSDIEKKDSRNGFFRTPTIIPFTANTQLSGKQEIGWFGGLRGRAGKLVTDDVLLYGTAGLAVARLHAKTRLSQTNCTPLINTCAVEGAESDSATRVGWTAGAGVEWALDRKWSVLADYQHVHLGTMSFRDSFTRFGLVSVLNTKVEANFNTNMLRVGVNYRFD